MGNPKEYIVTEEKQIVSDMLSHQMTGTIAIPSSSSLQNHHIIQIVRREFGVCLAEQDFTNCASIDDLADIVASKLPRLADGSSIITIFDRFRQIVAKEMHWTPQDVRWDMLWISVDDSKYDDNLVDWLMIEVFDEFKIPAENFKAFNLVWSVADTVRNIWIALGGKATWMEPPYEESWCPTQPIFYDIQAIIRCIHRIRLQRSRSLKQKILRLFLKSVLPNYTIDNGLTDNRPRPDHLIRQWVKAGWEERCLLDLIDKTYGVWLAKLRKYEPQWWRWGAGLLCFILAPALGIAIAEILDLPVAVYMILYIVIMVGIGYLLSRWSQPVIPREILTLRDLVILIRDQRAQSKPKPRNRFIHKSLLKL